MATILLVCSSMVVGAAVACVSLLARPLDALYEATK